VCKRGDVYFVDFGHNINSCKQSGIRPAIVVSNNKANEHSPVVTVVPLTSKTSKKRSLPTHVLIPNTEGIGLKHTSLALAEQLEAVDKTKLLHNIGCITNKHVMLQITKAVQVQIGVFEEYL
jgi:mRNA-degrading endonuclease toxin of MazEF toxin-antitoxin module